MSIKSDKWIRRMAEKEKMIEPFAPDIWWNSSIDFCRSANRRMPFSGSFE